MWMLDNRTKYAAERGWIRDKVGTHHWLVAVRATFDIGRDGKVTLADEQPPPLLVPEYWGDPATSGLRLDSDLVAIKPGTDVILDAHAHAPRERPAETVTVSLRLGPINKTLLVHGVRVYYKGLIGVAMSRPRPFTTAPIRYESAFGGADRSDPNPSKHRIDQRNPIGTGFALNPSSLVHQAAHRIEYPEGDSAKAGPAGFGPIDRWWSPRLERAGTYDARWSKTKKPLLADDYDDRFALCAPDDQRPSRPLRGGEPVMLTNMTRDGTLRFELPKVFLAFRTRLAEHAAEHRSTLTTVFIAPEQMKLSMTWQSTLPVAERMVDYLDVTTIREKVVLR